MENENKENKRVEESTEIFEKAPVPKAVLKNALPAMAAMLMVMIYNLADAFFIGQTGDDYQVAAVSLAMPVFLLFMSAGTIFGLGGTSVISRALGQKRLEYAKKVCSFCMWCCVGVGVIMAACYLIFMDQILSVIGASADTWDYTKSYLTIVSFCGPFVLISNCFTNVIRADGHSTQAMLGQFIGNLLNVILDPVFILGFGWGISGAAVATVIGNVVGACYYLVYFLRGKSILSIHPKYFTAGEGVCSGVLAIGVPAALGSAMMSVSNIVINNQMSNYGDMAVAGMGIAMKIVTMAGMVCMGLGQGVQPVLGYCVGAKMWDRFKKVLNFSLKFALCLGIVLTSLCFIFAGPIVNVFLTDPDAYSYAVRFARILLPTNAVFGVYHVLLNTLQAMGAATPALIINLSRQGFIFIPTLFILQAFLGITGIVFAQPVADILSIILAAVLYTRYSRKMMKQNAA